MIILDNFRSHHAKLTTKTARKLNIDLVFIPPYSPDINPIEFWKNNKKRTITTIHRNTRTNTKHNRNKLQSLLKINNIRQKMDKKILKKVKKD